MHRPVFIGVAGGTGSGKTTVAAALKSALPADRCVIVDHDAYYRDLAHLSFEDRQKVNFDDPRSLENELLIEHLATLRRGEAIDKPVYNFAEHIRSDETTRIEPAPVVIVEGILVLSDPKICAQLDVKVFVDTDPDVRVFRRIRRDLEERGRSFADIRRQYFETVRPMHLLHVEPCRRVADLIIPEGGENRVAIEVVATSLRRIAEAGLDT